MAYSYKEEEGYYVIYNGEERLKTPAGLPVYTRYRQLAERIVDDLGIFGYNYHSSSSILSWHFTCIDNFSRMGHDNVVNALLQSFFRSPDWTCEEMQGEAWSEVFGDWEERTEPILQWMQKATVMQLTAACCIANAYESINLPFVLAYILENYSGEERKNKLDFVAEMVASTRHYGTFTDIKRDFETFEFYYGIHLEEEGRAIENFNIDFPETYEHFELENLLFEEISDEALIGRNYQHYTSGKKDTEQPGEYQFADFVSDYFSDEEDDEEDEEDEEDDDGEDDDDEDDDLSIYLPDNCWVKRFADDEEPGKYYLLYIEKYEDGTVSDIGCVTRAGKACPLAECSFPFQECPLREKKATPRSSSRRKR